MKEKLIQYKSRMLQEPAIYAAYLSLQIRKPSDANEVKRFTDLDRDMMQLRYPAG